MKMMQCSVFRSNRRDYTYIYLLEGKSFDDIPDALSKVFGEPEFVIDLELSPGRQLAQEDVNEVMKNLDIENGLIVIPEKNETLEKSSRNVKGYKVISADGLNVYDILLHRRLVLLQPCLGQLEKRLLS